MEHNSYPRPEVLAPAGDLGRLKAALQYGADAVYLAGKEFGMRGGVPNFDLEQLAQGVQLAHQQGVKVYVTANTLQRNDEIQRYPQFVSYLQQIGVDAVIINDMGALMLTKQYAPRWSCTSPPNPASPITRQPVLFMNWELNGWCWHGS